MNKTRPIGFWLIMLLAIFLLLMLIIGQTGSLINYEWTVAIGLQESQYAIGDIGVALNKGFAVADTIIYVPILLIGIFGLWRKKAWGLFAMIGALAISMYWPISCLFFMFFAKGAPGIHFNNFTAYTISFLLITAVSLWAICYLYQHRQLFTQREN